jgi:cytosine/adenosine deaminase-related metal-dependent hydrolase
MSKIYLARWVLPIIAPAISEGAIVIDDSAIVSVGPRAEILSAFADVPHEDFGNAVILPGLINTHSHLELTVMRGFLEREEHDFFAWLMKLTFARFKMTDEDLFVSAACGAIEAARAGITCLGDASSLAGNAMRALNEVGLRAIVYQESFGPDPKVAEESLSKLRSQLDRIRPGQTELVRAGVSPHAPYTVSAPQLEMISRLAIAENLPVMMHAAESQAEKTFMQNGEGFFATALGLRGIQWQAPGVSTMRYLSDHGVLDTKPLLAHCVNVDQDDLQLIKNANAGIAHCPKSNAKLRHGRAPFAEFVDQELNVGLGSDSVASNNVCDILEEARFATLLARASVTDFNVSRSSSDPQTEVSATEALFAATLGGARALGLDHQVGALQSNMAADITIISLDGAHQQPVRDPHDAIVFCSSGRDVVLTMVAGKEVYRDNHVNTVDEENLRTRLESLRDKLDSD